MYPPTGVWTCAVVDGSAPPPFCKKRAPIGEEPHQSDTKVLNEGPQVATWAPSSSTLVSL